VKIARTATRRPAVIVFDHAFHGRTSLTMAMTAKVVPYKQGFGPFPGEVYRAPAPYPYRGVTSDDAIRGLELLLKQDVDPASVACVVLEPVQGEGGFVEMPAEFPGRLKEICESNGILFVDDEVQAGIGRTGPVWAIEHYGVEPDLIVSGKSLGGGLPLAGVTGGAEVMDSVPAGGLGGTFGGNPLACVAAVEVLREVKSDAFRKRAEELGARIRARLEQLAARNAAIGEVRGLGPMLALELTEPTPDLAKAVTAAARDRGLVLLSCGIYGNVIRILVPLTIDDPLLERGLDLLEESLGDARAC
jgi:4-aminobutyrate aminotransferase